MTILRFLQLVETLIDFLTPITMTSPPTIPRRNPMTMHRFSQIASATMKHFWPLVYMHLTPEEVIYLKTTPAAKTRLQMRIAHALAVSLMTEDQMAIFTANQEIQIQKLRSLPLPNTGNPISSDPDGTQPDPGAN